MSKKYQVPCSWQMHGYVEVEADTWQEAGDKVSHSVALQQNARSYAEEVDYSFEVMYEMMEDEEELETETYMRFPRDFDGAHHVNNEQERLDKFNKTNKVDRLQDLM